MFKELVFLAMAVTPFNFFASIQQIHTIQEAEVYFHLGDARTLGVFDIDETLLVPKDPACQKPNLRKHALIIQKIKGQLPLEYQDLISNLILFATHSQLIEPKSSLLIQNLQKKGIRLIALTAAMTRKFEDGYLPEARYMELKDNGIDFSLAFPELEYACLTDLKACAKGHPTFYRGILCSNGDHQRQKDATAKGEALCEFLKRTSWMPTRIIFIDDKLYNLEEMERTLKKFDEDIVYQGLHYVGAQSLISPDIDPQVIERKWIEVLEKAKMILEEYQFLEDQTGEIGKLCDIKK